MSVSFMFVSSVITLLLEDGGRREGGRGGERGKGEEEREDRSLTCRETYPFQGQSLGMHPREPLVS